MSTVLVVDDKEMMRDSVGTTLRRAGFGVLTASDGKSALESIARRRPDAVVTDLKMPGMTGLDLLGGIRDIDDDLPVVLMTAFGTIETAVEAMRRGAFDYITKPFEGDELIIAVKRALSHVRLVRENAVLRASAAPASAPSGASGEGVEGGEVRPRGLERIIGESPAMRAVKEQVLAVARSQGTVLVTGESGTGKEVIARAVHDLSPRSTNPFLAVNCAALSESLLESELFGHERGAFTGAEKLRKGRFELADNGTLLLDEVSEITPQLQAKLLRILQERAFERVGSSLTIGVDVRVVATSNRDLPAAAARNEFRSDLYYRLNVLPIDLPPLRERGEDVLMLAEHFVRAICRREGRGEMTIDPGARELLLAYRWPGNVRELQNICERAVVLLASGGESEIRRELIAPWLQGPHGACAGAAQGAGAVVAPAGSPVDAQGMRIGARPAGDIEGKPAYLTRAIHNGPAPSGERPRARPLYAEPGGEAASNGHHAPAMNGNGHHGHVNGAGSGFAAGMAVGAAVRLDGFPHASDEMAMYQSRFGTAELPGERTLADIERETIVATLQRFNGHRQKTAAALGIGVRTLGLKLKKWKTERLVPQSL